MKKSTVVLILICACILVSCNKAVRKEVQQPHQSKQVTGKEGAGESARYHEFGLQWTLSFDGAVVRLDSIGVDDMPAVILQQGMLKDSITGRVNKDDDMFSRGFRNKISITNDTRKLAVPVNESGHFSFKAGDILKKGNNKVYFDLVVRKGFWLTQAIGVMFMVSERVVD